MGKKQLEVGDIIVQKNGSRYKDFFPIERLTKTTAFARHLKFRLEYDPERGYLTERGDTGLFTSYWIATPAMKKEAIRQQNLDKLNNFYFGDLTDEQINSIISIISKQGKTSESIF